MGKKVLQSVDDDLKQYGQISPSYPSLDVVNEQLTDKAKKTGANILDYGAVSSTVVYDSTNKVYNMTDCTQAFVNAINSGYNTVIVPDGDYLVNNMVTISKRVNIIGNNARIYSNPIATGKSIFRVNENGSGTLIEGISFYSKNDYKTSLTDPGATAITSNVSAIDVVGSAIPVTNITIRNCYGENLSYFASCMKCNNIDFSNIKTEECYFCIFTGFSVSNIKIRNSHLKCRSVTDIFGHVLYFGYDTHYVTVEDSILDMVGAGSNIVKVGSNEGASDNIVLKNCKLTGVTTSTFLYTHNGADISLYNCIIDTKSSASGYGRLLQFNDNSSAYFKGCNITLDSFDKYTQNASYVNNSIIFEDCNIKIKNTVVSYCGLPFIAGAKTFKFIKCIIDWSAMTYAGVNLLDNAIYSVDLFNCRLILNGGQNFGQGTQSSIAFTNTNTPLFRAVNCVFERAVDAGGNVFLNNVVNGSYIAQCQLVNVTLINCDAKTGGSAGLYKTAGVESQYNQLVNVLNISK